ncbi:hypothetical protein BU23DRAFT_550997, partial [Bimuria novae-zelandiae CBS 107.79]
MVLCACQLFLGSRHGKEYNRSWVGSATIGHPRAPDRVLRRLVVGWRRDNGTAAPTGPERICPGIEDLAPRTWPRAELFDSRTRKCLR